MNRVELTRRTMLLASLSALRMGRTPNAARAVEGDLILSVPYMSQGGSGDDETVNCGPTVVAMAVNYSEVSSPSVAMVRRALAVSGPTAIDQWTWLLDVYGTPWYPVWSRDDITLSLRKGHPVVVASWMAEFSAAGDFETPWADPAPWEGRYCDYAEGHALLIAGLSADGYDYFVHDPNVFPGDPAHHYSDGSPRGAFRRYLTDEVWQTVSTYGGGMGVAVVPNIGPLPPASRIKRVDADQFTFNGPGGGQRPRREVNEF